ncbi:DUF5330 domain-containing protein [Pararhizobium sp.]|uniref:DUF5330 domain-containing protein n=1 Tax=Pararhizobium sp. TaxID=1977563 RepID=UPI002717F9FD|nr:DUF5330 domain-containing protein [Pararhizobium sp.]MDO9417320.1 DUF5330 domain-containing protein [Pararhizobium sp.]
MWFLIKGTFWFSLVLVLLPFLDPAASSKLEKGPTVELGGTFQAATEAFDYIRAICVEKPDVCEKGGETFVALGHRAREGARIAYEFLGDKFAEPSDAVLTGTVGNEPVTEEPFTDDTPALEAIPQTKPLDLKAALAKK